MLRFALSPTGDMNIGDLRIALFSYIVSRQRGEDFIVRIEDTDKEHNIEGKDKEILEILSLFGIEYSQVIYQSQNVRFHSAMALQLLHEKKAFSCFCSQNWLDSKRAEARLAKKAYKYDDACRNLPPQLVIDNTNPFTVRIARPDTTSLESDSIDSFIIMNQDKTPTYDFACAVDDMLNDISIVIRNEDHKTNTLKQEHVRASLNYDKKIEYTYLAPLLFDEKLSVKSLLEEGYLPEAILNYLILSGNETSQEIFTIQDAIEWFDLNKISHSPTRFDIEMLRHINREHLKSLDAKELSRYVGFADEEVGELARIYLEDLGTTKELKSKIAPIFEARNIPQEIAKQTQLMKDVIKNAPYFDKYDDFKEYVIAKTGLHNEEYLKPMRILLTNAEDGPAISEIYRYIKNYIGEIIK